MREAGFYWVKGGEEWEIAGWSIDPNGVAWFVTGWDCPADNYCWQQIDELRIVLEEVK